MLYATVTRGNEEDFERGFSGIVEALFGIGKLKISAESSAAAY
jgi:hypothetical protein